MMTGPMQRTDHGWRTERTTMNLLEEGGEVSPEMSTNDAQTTQISGRHLVQGIVYHKAGQQYMSCIQFISHRIHRYPKNTVPKSCFIPALKTIKATSINAGFPVSPLPVFTA
jgi:hypothetical protein